MRLRISSKAQSDLDEIWLAIAHDKPNAADKFIDRLHDCFLLLTTQPRMGTACPELAPAIMRFPVGEYLVFYRPRQDLVEIVRVLRASRDTGAAFHENADG